MYLFINAIKNIGRNKGRNILIGTIMLALITVSIISLSINNTAGSIIDDYKTRFGSEVTINIDMSKIMNVNDLVLITPQQYFDFAKSEYLMEAILSGSAYVSSEDTRAVDEDEGAKPSDAMTELMGTAVTMQLIGGKWDEFDDGYRSLYNGSMPINSGECIISKELADINNLQAGDKITLESSAMTMMGYETKLETFSYELTITGIYLDTREAYPSFVAPFANRRNEILTPIETFAESSNFAIGARYYLKHPSMLDNFEAELREKGLSELYLVGTNETSYQKIIGPVEGLKNVSLAFMFIVLAFGAVIIILLSSIAIRERKYEIGVLRAMGMKKRKVIFGLWSETLMITACCLVIGFGIGSALTQPVSDALLAGQIENAKTVAEQESIGMQGSGVVYQTSIGSQEQDLIPLEELTVFIGINTIIEIAIIALLLASLASMVAIAKVTKYEPIKILMERN